MSLGSAVLVANMNLDGYTASQYPTCTYISAIYALRDEF